MIKIKMKLFTLRESGFTKDGLTLIELMTSIVLLVILTGVVVYVLRAVLLSWSSQETRAGVDISLERGIEEIVRDLREVKAVQSSNDEIKFTVNEGGSDVYYIYYFYNATDPYPPTFVDPNLLYQLRKASLTGGIGGTLTDSGRIIITDVLSPSHATSPSDLSFSSNIATIDLSITRRDETIRSRTQVNPRNL